jgi:hypothetical protein
MKQLIQILALSTLTFGLTACDPFEGLLQVKKAFTVISTEKTGSCGGEAGDFNCEQKVNVQIPVGDQNAKLDFVGRDQVQITLKVDGRKKQITMDLPKNANIPQNGEFMITATDLQQSFSIKGGSATNTSDSQSFRGYEQCTYTRYETVCNIVNNQQVCHQVPRTVYGQQYVEYFNRVTNQNINVNFIEKTAVASFNGSRSSSQKIYTHKDYCF